MAQTLDVDALLQLAGSGNWKSVEEKWMAALDADGLSPAQIAAWSPILEELSRRDRQAQAETLAWTTIEALKERFSAVQALEAAGAFLLKLADSAELRRQVTELYREAHADRPELAALLAESGLAGGRPVRRALRILDTALTVRCGACLVGRHDDAVVRVESLVLDPWRVSISGPGGPAPSSPWVTENLGPVELADRYAPAEPDDVRVLRVFDADRLKARLESDPVGAIVGILKSRGGLRPLDPPCIDGDTLQHMLCPSLIPESGWSKWWSAARTALKRSANVRVEGRSPYYLTYVAAGETLEQETLARFRTLSRPAEQLTAIEGYLRECRARKQTPDPAMLTLIRGHLLKQTEREQRASSPVELTARLIVAAMDQACGVTAGADAAAKALADAEDMVELARHMEIASLWPQLLDLIARAAGERRIELLTKLLPVAPQAACELIGRRLCEAGLPPEQFDRILQEVLADPVRCFDALAWLWDGSETARQLPAPPLITMLTRILTVLGDARQRDKVSAAIGKELQAKARAALSARKYERFVACLGEIEAGMAMALRTQIARLDNLGRVVHEDLLIRIRQKFPELYSKPRIAVWQQADVIYVTREGKARKEAEVSELVNVKMRDNARAIGEAAARGDLSENSEYKFALEERDLLRARLAQMQDEMGRARLIEPDDVPADEVGIGSRVVLKDQASASTLTLSFLGPWDSDLERGIVNYHSPLGQSLMGRHVGDALDIELGDCKGKYIVDHIDSAFATTG